MNAWDEVLAESASDAEEQLNEECPACGDCYAEHIVTGDRTMRCRAKLPAPSCSCSRGGSAMFCECRNA